MNDAVSLIITYVVFLHSDVLCRDCGGWRFVIQPERKTWTDAKNYCESHDGMLWRPVSDIWRCAQSFIYQHANWVWTGANNIDRDYGFEWDDGSPVLPDQTVWIAGEPNNERGLEYCVEASYRGWNDNICSNKFRFACQYPICGGRTILDEACKEEELNDTIYYRGGDTRNQGGGYCASPSNCTNCQDGFYANGGYCSICPKIANCNHRRCKNVADNYCEWCKYEIKDKPYWRAYSRHKDGQRKQCHKTCSWRPDSTRCYPGNCTDEVVESCICTEGFGGDQCDRITEETSILYAEIKLHTPTNEILTLPADPNYPGSEPIKFTKNANFTEAEIEFHAKYVASGTIPAHDRDGEKHYVTDFRHGIIHGYITIDYLRCEPH